MEKVGSCLRVYMRHLFCSPLALPWGFPAGSVVRNLPAVQETGVPSPDREDPLEEGMATHSGILAWRIPWWDSIPVVTKESDTTEHAQTSLACLCLKLHHEITSLQQSSRACFHN